MDTAVFIFSINQKFLPCSTASPKPVHRNCTRVDSTYIKSAIAKLTNRIQRELKILPDVIKAHNLPTWGQSEPTATNTTPNLALFLLKDTKPKKKNSTGGKLKNMTISIAVRSLLWKSIQYIAHHHHTWLQKERMPAEGFKHPLLATYFLL